MKAIVAQFRTELALSLRNGEQLLVNLFIPLGLLIFFSKVKVLSSDTPDPVDFLAPAVLGLAVMSSALVSLGISTGFERFYGVLKRLGATPARPAPLGRRQVRVRAGNRTRSVGRPDPDRPPARLVAGRRLGRRRARSDPRHGGVRRPGPVHGRHAAAA